jgi:hypothetical protein
VKFFTRVFFVVVASYAESRLSKGNLNQPGVAFFFMSAGKYKYKSM